METAKKKGNPNIGLVKKTNIIGTNFEASGESFELIKNVENLYVYRRTKTNSGKLVAYEVVVGSEDNMNYPRSEAFGTRGWCYTGTDERCKRRIEQDFRSIRF